MDIIQEVGSYAGFAAVVGLAVLSALYFSQARDVRRLREWAGRAPERAAEQGVPGQTVLPEEAAQDAVRPVPSGAVRPIPAAKPAAAAATGAAPAAATAPAEKPATPPGDKPAVPAPAGKPAPGAPAAPVPATAAANAAKGAPGKPAAAPATAAATAGAAKPDAKVAGAAPAAGAPAPATPAAAPAQGKPGAPGGAQKPAVAPAGAKPAAPAGPPPAVRPSTLPPRPGPVGRTPASAASQSTAVLPASARPRDPGVRSGRGRRDGLDARYIALIVAGVIVIGGGVAFGVSQLGGDDKPASSGDGSNAADRQAPINPTTVTVSVLNGTTVPGLAAQIGDEVESAGFQRGNVANAIDQQRPASVVLFAEGADREARLVARRLSIARVEPIDPDSQALAGNASVVVIVGTDQTQ